MSLACGCIISMSASVVPLSSPLLSNIRLPHSYKDTVTAFSAHLVKNLPAVQETLVLSLGWEDPLENEWLPTPVSLPRDFQGQRKLAAYSPWDCKEQ